MARNHPISPKHGPSHPHRPGSFYLATVTGIPIYIHFTLVLLLLYVAWVEIRDGQRLWGGLLVIVLIFISIALHELGHALMARRYGIRTDDIVLYPIGGVARLHSLGEGLQEFWITLAGPVVNLLIAGALWTVLHLTGRWAPLDRFVMAPEGYLFQQVMLINLILVIFNLVPAFPMDGGRILRSLLTQVMTKEKATGIAATIGKALAILFIVIGLLQTQYILLSVIGLFIFMAAGQEHAATRSVALMADRKVGDAMIRRFEILNHGDTLGRAADLLLSTSQHDFPVLGGSEVIGVLSRNALIQGLATHGRDHYVAEVMIRDFPRVSPQCDLQDAFLALRDAGDLPLLVFDGERLAGYITGENLMEYLMIARSGENQR